MTSESRYAISCASGVPLALKAFQKLSLLDFPGKVAAVAWVGGCNFRCPFCYNRDLVLAPDSMPSIPEADVVDYLLARRRWIDGIVVTGGEPTIYPSLLDFLERVKELGFVVKLDTNGSNPLLLKEILRRKLVDYIALDVKAPLLEEKYRKATGLRGEVEISERIRRSIGLILDSNGVDYEFRTTVVPRLLNREDLLLIARELEGAKRYYLQQFKQAQAHVDPSYSTLSPYPREMLEEIRRRISKHFSNCGVRG